MITLSSHDLIREALSIGREHPIPEHDYILLEDGLIPEELRVKLETVLDAIANGPSKDYHPNTDGKVLVHFSKLETLH